MFTFPIVQPDSVLHWFVVTEIPQIFLAIFSARTPAGHQAAVDHARTTISACTTTINQQQTALVSRRTTLLVRCKAVPQGSPYCRVLCSSLAPPALRQLSHYDQLQEIQATLAALDKEREWFTALLSSCHRSLPYLYQEIPGGLSPVRDNFYRSSLARTTPSGGEAPLVPLPLAPDTEDPTSTSEHQWSADPQGHLLPAFHQTSEDA